MHPLERLVNLVGLLLDAARPLTFDEIRGALSGAYTQDDADSAKRQFERDKETLRAIGIPVESVGTDGWDVERGYTIPADRYYLPEISFTPEEAAALFVAAHAPPRDGVATQAFRKLATGIDAAIIGDVHPTAGSASAEPNLAAVAEAVTARHRVRFRYETGSGETSRREVDAWGVLFRRGYWYLVGLDADRGKPRSFRLSRMRSRVKDVGEGSDPPEGFDAEALLASGPWGLGEPETTARVAFSAKVAWWAVAGVPGARTAGTRPDGWTEADVPAVVGDSFVAWILSFGPDAEAVAPPRLRERVVRALETAGDR